MSKASDVAYGRQGGRLVDPGASAEEAVAAVAGMRSSAKRAGRAWPSDRDPETDLAHPRLLARDVARRRELAARWPDGLPKGHAGEEARAYLALVKPTPAELEHAWMARARQAHARYADDLHHEPEIPPGHAPSLDAIDREAIDRYPTPPTIADVGAAARKAQP